MVFAFIEEDFNYVVFGASNCLLLDTLRSGFEHSWHSYITATHNLS